MLPRQICCYYVYSFYRDLTAGPSGGSAMRHVGTDHDDLLDGQPGQQLLVGSAPHDQIPPRGDSDGAGPPDEVTTDATASQVGAEGSEPGGGRSYER